MELEIKLPDHFELKPKIVVVGVGGAGVNAVDNMIEANVQGVEFWGANTDAQALKKSIASNKMQLGVTLTKGLGAGSNPLVGKSAAEESSEQISNILCGSNMLFITAGMGGGTGTGAAPVIAKIAKELGILTVGVVTKPFHFEGGKRMKTAEVGLKELEQYVDTLIVIPNQNLFRVANEATTFAEAFKKADDVLRSGVTSITDLIVIPGLINLDFADISTVMSEMGQAVMGTGEAEGKDRSIKASEAAISNPILDNTSMKGARGLLINITGGNDMTLFEIDEAVSRIKDEVDKDANIIFGSTLNDELYGKIRVSVVATGIGFDNQKHYASTDTIKNNVYNNSFQIREDTLIYNENSTDEKIGANVNKNLENTIYTDNTNTKDNIDSINFVEKLELLSKSDKLNKNINSINNEDVHDTNITNRDNAEYNMFDSENFLMKKGFFITPKPLEPEEDEIQNQYCKSESNSNTNDLTGEENKYCSTSKNQDPLEKNKYEQWTENTGNECNKNENLSEQSKKQELKNSIFSKMFRSKKIVEDNRENKYNLEREDDKKILLETPAFLRRKK